MQYTEYRSFMEKLEDTLSEMLEDLQPVKVGSIYYMKNNGVVNEELQSYSPERKIGKVLDPKPFFERHLAGTQIEQLADEIIDFYLKEEPEEISQIWKNIRNYESVKSRIFLRVVNYNDNQMLLSLCPHIPVVDLALTFRIEISDVNDSLLSMTVDQNIFKNWAIDFETLKKDAMKNTMRKFPADIISVFQFLNSFLDDFERDELEDLHENFFAITNKRKINGATAVFYPGVLKALAEKIGSDLYLMPSSIHEMMVVPCDDCEDVSLLKCAVHDANETVVSKEERLSGSVYRYSRADDQLNIVV